jgi:hypothetical protein
LVSRHVDVDATAHNQVANRASCRNVGRPPTRLPIRAGGRLRGPPQSNPTSNRTHGRRGGRGSAGSGRRRPRYRRPPLGARVRLLSVRTSARCPRWRGRERWRSNTPVTIPFQPTAHHGRRLCRSHTSSRRPREAIRQGADLVRPQDFT